MKQADAMLSRLLRLIGVKREPNCQEVRAASSDYVDGDLSAAESSRIESHLAWCGACAAFVRTLQATVDALRSIARTPAPTGFSDRVRARLEAEL